MDLSSKHLTAWTDKIHVIMFGCWIFTKHEQSTWKIVCLYPEGLHKLLFAKVCEALLTFLKVGLSQFKICVQYSCSSVFKGNRSLGCVKTGMSYCPRLSLPKMYDNIVYSCLASFSLSLQLYFFLCCTYSHSSIKPFYFCCVFKEIYCALSELPRNYIKFLQ